MSNQDKKPIDVVQLVELWPSRYPTKKLEELTGHRHCVLYAKAKAIGLKPRSWYWTNGIDRIEYEGH